MDSPNHINHIVLLLDASSSMGKHKQALVQVADNEVAYLATRSKELNQETRVTIYSFASGSNYMTCHAYDMDVLRMPSIKGLYYPNGMTALIDATLKAISDLEQTATLYGEHAFLMYVLTDGLENASKNRPPALNAKLQELYKRNNWTVAAFVPDQRAVFEAKQVGFQSDNISVWDTNSTYGIEEVGKIMRAATNQFMENRAKGITSSKSLFKLRKLTTQEILSELTPLAFGAYTMMYVHEDTRIDDFVNAHPLVGPYKIGKGYYQLSKPEDIQPQKQIAISYGNRIYTGNARELLGLPDDKTVRVKPEDHLGYTIFVQSTALNRKLIHGTNVLVMR